MNSLPATDASADITRRHFFRECGYGVGKLALAGLLINSFARPAGTHFTPKAKRVIHIFSQGAPSHLDTWDHKPALAKHADQNVKAIGGVPLPAQFGFKKMGQSGTPVSEVFDQIGQHVDDIAVINSMHTNIPSHEFATVMMNTGAGRMVKPSMGSWMLLSLIHI